VTDTAGARILVADDDPAVRVALERVLSFNGYDVILAADGVQTLDAIERGKPDAVVLDVMMPYVDGLSTCRMLRGRQDDLPVLMLTARTGLPDRVAGLDAGADDYLAKPFELDELLARLRALLRRAKGFGGRHRAAEMLRFADLTLNVHTREAFRGERPLKLTRTEFDLLEILMRQPRHVLDRSRIASGVWGHELARGSKSLDVYIGYLRRKTEEAGEPRLIHTVRAVGYSLREHQP
jgi:two-component system response regulator MprA